MRTVGSRGELYLSVKLHDLNGGPLMSRHAIPSFVVVISLLGLSLAIIDYGRANPVT